MLTNFLDDLRFFQPSVRVTKGIVSAIQNAHLADLARVGKDQNQIEQDEDDMPDGFGTEANKLEDCPSITRAELEDETLFQQRKIASELFSYLAFQAENPRAKAGHAMSIHNSLLSGMSVSLGLSEQNLLLSQLASEFCAWLKEQGEFMAGWGRVIYAESDHMYLEEFPAEDLDSDESKNHYASALSS